MNTIEKFLQKILLLQDLTPEQERTLQSHKTEVTNFLRSEFGNDPVIKYAGSHEKGTMIRDNYDLDIVCYFPDTDNRSLKEIREDVSNHLKSKYLIEEKASAERISDLRGVSSPSGYHIDVVPGRFIEGTDDVFLHIAHVDKERIQTNLKTHINHIANSGCVPIIRLIKIWANRNRLNIKTFILELFVVEVLSGSYSKNNLQESFLKVMEAMKDRFGSVQLIDPANTNNIVSQTINSADKIMVNSAGEKAFNLLSKSEKISDWENIFGETQISSSPSSGFIPQALWCGLC
jgi:hypothetical protein